MFLIRRETPDDIAAIRVVNERAFGQPQEARIVDKLRESCGGALSLVADSDSQIVGHILFTPAIIEGKYGAVGGMGLAPMAVLPEYQRQSIGSALVIRGLELLRESGCPFVVVLGHPAYYLRFGFVPAFKYGIYCQWDGVPNDAFMALVLDENAMAGVSGLARYRAEFDEAM